MIENTFVVFTYAIKMFQMKKSIKVSLYSILLFLVLFGLASVFWLADLRTSQIKNGDRNILILFIQAICQGGRSRFVADFARFH